MNVVNTKKAASARKKLWVGLMEQGEEKGSEEKGTSGKVKFQPITGPWQEG